MKYYDQSKIHTKSIPQLNSKETEKEFYRRHSDLVFDKLSSYKRFQNKKPSNGVLAKGDIAHKCGDNPFSDSPTVEKTDR